MTQLFYQAEKNQTSPALDVHPAGRNTTDIRVVVTGDYAGANVTVQWSPTTGLDDWIDFTPVAPGGGSFEVDDPVERIRAKTGDFSGGTANVYIQTAV